MNGTDIPALPVYGFDPSSLSGVLSLIVAVLLPLLVGLVTTRTTSAGVKAVLLLAAAAIKSVLEAWLAAVNSGAHFSAVPVLLTVVANFGIAVAVHFGLWKPTGAANAAQRALNGSE